MIGERLRERMAALGIGQTELARRVGVKQPTIHKLLNNQRYGSTHLHRIARELGTTAAYLEGETDDPDLDAPGVPELTSDERDLLESFRVLTPKDRMLVRQLVRSLAGHGDEPTAFVGPSSESVHVPKSEFHPEGR